MAMDAFVSLNTDGGRGNDGAGAKPSGGNSQPARPILRAVVRMAAEVAAQPVRWLWEEQLALGKIAVVAGAANVGKSLPATRAPCTRDFVMRIILKPATLWRTTLMMKMDRRSEVPFLEE